MSTLRAPTESPLGLSQDGVITNPAWLAYFNRGITPAITGLVAGAQSPDDPLAIAKPYLRQQDGAALSLESRQRVYPSDGFPPPAPGAVRVFDLSMLAASQTGRQQPPWIIADTLANQGKYPNSSFPVDSLFLATDKNPILVYYNTGAAWALLTPLADGKIWVGNGSGLPAPVTPSGDLTMSDTGDFTLDTVNADVGTYGDSTDVAQVTVNAKGLVTAAASVPISYPPAPAGFPGFTGTLAAAVAAGKNVSNGVIQP